MSMWLFFFFRIASVQNDVVRYSLFNVVDIEFDTMYPFFLDPMRAFFLFFFYFFFFFFFLFFFSFFFLHC